MALRSGNLDTAWRTVRETLPLFSQDIGSRTLRESSSGVWFLNSRRAFLKHHTDLSIVQDRMFTSFLILLIPPTVVNAVVPKFYQNRALWEARELPSRIYGWVAFCTASVVTEIPIAIIGATIYWALWYWPTGLPSDSSTSGYVYLMTVLFVRVHEMNHPYHTDNYSSSSKPPGVSGSALLPHPSLSSRTSCHFFL
jgi:hypothetical protein